MGQGAKGAGLGKLGGRGARRQVAAGRVGEEGKEIFFIIKVAESLCLPSKHTFEYLIKDQLLWVLGKVIGKIHRRPWGKFVGRKINPVIIFYYTNTACLWWQKCIIIFTTLEADCPHTLQNLRGLCYSFRTQ